MKIHEFQAKELLRELGMKEDVRCVGIQASVWEQQLFKAWPTEHMAELCSKLWLIHGIIPIIIGTKGQDRLTSFLREHHPSVYFLDCVGKFTIAELPNLVAECEAVVTNDSGLMHLSAAVGTSTLVIYGMTNPDITWVYGDDPKHKIIRRSACVPCYGWSPLAESCTSRACLKNITPATVLDQLLKIPHLSGVCPVNGSRTKQAVLIRETSGSSNAQ